jgi:hypothetical protein
MKKTMEEAKAKYKNSFVQTRVDVENKTLRVSYRHIRTGFGIMMWTGSRCRTQYWT